MTLDDVERAALAPVLPEVLVHKVQAAEGREVFRVKRVHSFGSIQCELAVGGGPAGISNLGPDNDVDLRALRHDTGDETHCHATPKEGQGESQQVLEHALSVVKHRALRDGQHIVPSQHQTASQN